MSDQEVDLSQIRGDWDFHSRYATNAMDQTLKRVNKLWAELKKASTKKDQVPVEGPLLDDFIEACMQARSLTDDFSMLADCRPTTKKKAKKKAKKKVSKVAKKASKKTAKKKTSKKAGGRK